LNTIEMALFRQRRAKMKNGGGSAQPLEKSRFVEGKTLDYPSFGLDFPSFGLDFPSRLGSSPRPGPRAGVRGGSS
jgi:hypothetical protein